MNTATTQFSGVSVWALVPTMSQIIHEIAQKYKLDGHPPHLTLVYDIPITTEEEGKHSISNVRQRFKKLCDSLRHSEAVSLTPTHMESGISKLFGHGYCDLFFEIKEDCALSCLFQTTMDTMEWDKKKESFFHKPHACLAYWNPNTLPEEQTANIQQDILELYPELLAQSFLIEEVALWSTEGTLQNWTQLDSFPLSSD
eukprot:TRINITY_DN78288_c0_g1_i1.p1 TRINITY_DN78288_c0_g1~~TRINITY_DN78288_c0_g1_i1.p1  ORF type:complete len:199 (+),score=7.55 TRINITY_DN78288_c0_g1_i1:41-637(+)